MGDVMTRSQMTPEGRALFATFNPLDHPTSNCASPGLPSVAVIPELQEWSANGRTLTIRHESYGFQRKVHFDETSHPALAHTLEGHAIGRIDGDTLTIDTANLTAEWGGLGRNAPGSAARTVRETYRLVSPDRIEGVIEISDPNYLVHPLQRRVTLDRQPAGTKIVDFPCDPEVAKRDYDYISQAQKSAPH
ncbi:MAG: hypothetical protein GC155_18220 [Alphaproteobacteria bacterium]|nr:hypothetical protein [Alphaproteobacteria bacterium]